MIKSKLKRRLRKKFHLGEFQEFGFEISVNFKKGIDEIQFNKFWHDIIGEIENAGFLCGGSGDYNRWQVFVTSKKKFTSPTNEEQKKIRIWFENRWEVKDCKIGELLDAWNIPKWN